MLNILIENFFKFIFPFFLFINILGFTSLPFTKIFFKKDTDEGYSKSLILGLIMLSWIYFGLCTLAYILNIEFLRLKSSYSLTTATLIWLGINALIFFKYQNLNLFKIKNYLLSVATLFILMIFFYLVHAFNPRIHPFGSENFMNLGVLNSIFYSENVPVNDFWFAGFPLNYYYFGHFTFATVLKFLNLTPNEAFFFLAGITPTLFFTALLIFIKNLYLDINEKKSEFEATFAGIIGIIFTFFISPIVSIYGLFELVLNSKTFRNLFESYPTFTIRVIDNTIAENYNYAFLLNPLHGHTTNLIIGIVVLGLFYNFFREKQIFRASNPSLVLSFFLIGVMFTISSWDLVVYLGLFSFLYLNLRFKDFKNNFTQFIKTCIMLAYPIILGAIFWSLYYLPSAGLPDIVKKGSDLVQFLNFWGLYLTLILFIYIYFIKVKLNNFLHSTILFSLLILLFIEIIYFSDANKYNAYYRANTYYKFSNVIILLFSVFIATYFTKFLFDSKKIALKVILIFLIVATFWVNSIYMVLKTEKLFFTGITNQENQLKIFSENTYELYQNMKNILEPNLVIVEGNNNKSYTSTNYISVYTGIPAVIGWQHEYTWRMNNEFLEEIDRRYKDIEEIYTGEDPNSTYDLINKYQVNYVIITKSEREIYKEKLQEAKLDKIGEIVFEKGDAKLIKITRN